MTPSRSRILPFIIALILVCEWGHAASILQGMIQGQVRVTLTSARGTTSGDSMSMQVLNVSSSEVTLEVPSGLIARPENAAAPSMAIRALKGRRVDEDRYEPLQSIRLKPNEQAVYVLEAYSVEIGKPAPAQNSVYSLDGMHEDLGRLFAMASKLDVKQGTLQAAVWILTSPLPLEQLKNAIPVSPQEFGVAADLAQEAKRKGAPIAPTLPTQSAALQTPVASAARQAPLIVLESTSIQIGQEGKRRSATVGLRYKWSVPPAQRPAVYVVAVRFESSEMTSAVVPGRMVFDGGEGAYESVVEQGALQGKGELVYAVLRDMTEATDSVKLNKIFDEFSKQTPPGVISNVLRVPVDWRTQGDTPLDHALAVISGTPVLATVTPAATAIATPIPAQGPAATPKSLMAAAAKTPAALDKALATPVTIDLQMKNGGILRGELLGVRQGKLVLKGRMREFEFTPSPLGTAEEILAQAQSAQKSGKMPEAAQWAAIASLLLQDPSPANAILQQKMAQ